MSFQFIKREEEEKGKQRPHSKNVLTTLWKEKRICKQSKSTFFFKHENKININTGKECPDSSVIQGGVKGQHNYLIL